MWKISAENSWVEEFKTISTETLTGLSANGPNLTLNKKKLRKIGIWFNLLRCANFENIQHREINSPYMCDDISLAKITTKPRFDSTKRNFFHLSIPKAVKMEKWKEWKEWKEYPRENNTRATKVWENKRCTNEAWWILSMWRNRTCDVIAHKT